VKYTDTTPYRIIPLYGILDVLLVTTSYVYTVW